MTFAYINEAWGAVNDGKRKKSPESLKTNTPPTVYPDDDTHKSNFVDYDDFYKNDFMYSSAMHNNHQDAEVKKHQEVVPASSTTSANKIHQPLQYDVHENFSSHDTSSSKLENGSSFRDRMGRCNEEQNYLEFALFVICGIFLILIMEQFLQIGIKCAK